MHSYTILFALVSATANLAVAAPRDVAEESPILHAWSQPDHTGDMITAGSVADVKKHPEQDGSTATCNAVPHKFISSLTLAQIDASSPYVAGKPYGCMLFAEDKCTGESRWVQMGNWDDVRKLSDLNNFDFDKRTASFKCWFKDSW